MRKPELTVLVNTGQLGLQNSKLDSYKINVLAMNIIIFKNFTNCTGRSVQHGRLAERKGIIRIVYATTCKPDNVNTELESNTRGRF